jgi:hypothetical protein
MINIDKMPYELLKESFLSWSKKGKYVNVYKNISKETKEIGLIALKELKLKKPGEYWTWWAINHNRFIRLHQQRELSRLHEVMHYFLTDLARGDLGKNGKEEENEALLKKRSRNKSSLPQDSV